MPGPPNRQLLGFRRTILTAQRNRTDTTTIRTSRMVSINSYASGWPLSRAPPRKVLPIATISNRARPGRCLNDTHHRLTVGRNPSKPVTIVLDPKMAMSLPIPIIIYLFRAAKYKYSAILSFNCSTIVDLVDLFGIKAVSCQRLPFTRTKGLALQPYIYPAWSG